MRKLYGRHRGADQNVLKKTYIKRQPSPRVRNACKLYHCTIRYKQAVKSATPGYWNDDWLSSLSWVQSLACNLLRRKQPSTWQHKLLSSRDSRNIFCMSAWERLKDSASSSTAGALTERLLSCWTPCPNPSRQSIPPHAGHDGYSQQHVVTVPRVEDRDSTTAAVEIPCTGVYQHQISSSPFYRCKFWRFCYISKLVGR